MSNLHAPPQEPPGTSRLWHRPPTCSSEADSRAQEALEIGRVLVDCIRFCLKRGHKMPVSGGRG